jgi:hypothetical protein
MKIIRFSVVVSGLAMLVMPGLYAQITREVRANIPFDFYVQETHLPAGTYVIRAASDDDLNVLEIQSEDGKTAVDFEMEPTQMASTPAHSELFFHRYGNKEYLSRIFQGGEASGGRVLLTRSELKIEKHGAKPEEHSVPAETK